MQRSSVPPAIGAPATNSRTAAWVQTERAAHEAWALLIKRKPRAAMLLHHLVARMGHQNAVVASQKTLAKLMGCSVDTVQRALRDLEAARWIQVVKLNGPGTVAAYVVNSRVAWGQHRDQLRLSVFRAAVVADAEDQDSAALDSTELRRIPMLVPDEQQLSAEPSLDPPSQPVLEGFEPDLPALDEHES
jgi:DNA-binding transcriptional MocR family regulator